MIGKNKDMDAKEIAKIIEYIISHDTSDTKICDIRQKFNLSVEEFNEIYELAMPAVRGFNEGSFWRLNYYKLEGLLIQALKSPKKISEKIKEIEGVIRAKSARVIKQERLKEWAS